tara:strand:- start:141 stop:347 length:207 start_codon:yes stop_codon:yes gene_type:complete
MSEWTDYVIELHKDKSGSSWWCQEKIRVPLTDDDNWDEDALQYSLEHELLPRMIALVNEFFAEWSDEE